jgi:predicted Zn-dependent peptidase
MKKIILIIFLIGQVIMAAQIKYLHVNDVEIPVIFENDKRLPLVNMQFVFTNAGSITDVKKAGLARFSAKVMNEGTKTLGSSGFAKALESRAISISSSTGRETFVTEISSLKEEFDVALDYFAQLLKEPNITQQSIQKTQTMTMGSISSKENDFDYVASNELKKLLFGKSVLSQATLGTKDSIKSINAKDVEDFIKANLVYSKLIVVLGGDVDFEAIKPKLKKLISILPKGKKIPLKHYDVIKDAKDSTIKKDTKQAYVYFGSPYDIKSGDKEYYKARVAIFILGTGGFGSRLMEEIRVKKGLAYSAYARVHVSKSCNYLSGYLQTKLKSQQEAIKSVKEVVRKFVKNGVTQEELEQTKKFLLGSEPLRVETLSQRLNRTFMEYYNGYELGHYKKELQKIKELSLDDLNKFIKKHKEILNLRFAVVTK